MQQGKTQPTRAGLGGVTKHARPSSITRTASGTFYSRCLDCPDWSAEARSEGLAADAHWMHFKRERSREHYAKDRFMGLRHLASLGILGLLVWLHYFFTGGAL